MRLLLMTLALAGAATAQPAEFRTVQADAVQWQPIPDGQGAQSALIAGNPSQPGTYVIRVKFPPHVMDRPHHHSRDRHVTVLQGRWFAGTGPAFAPDKAQVLPVGSYMFHPAGGVHWDGSNSDDTVIVQIIGEGPVSSADVDPALASWVKLPG
ncbi:cupin domain-containing protein [Sandarakinorhabdus sp. AAP62]|uniref:cupin domain-containing protein n=1 Tax=Sandarakinorhabdus sp. AAP62 TaxID=1248916 RepID=UPI0002DF98BF|nr:cupin domain-containing protein [Sandarakinorhabdus sp. AAP62]